LISADRPLVLVTGGSGFIASHAIVQLLAAGHDVRTSVRTLKREADVRAMLRQAGAEPGDRLAFVAADLESDTGWPEAVAGCEYVLHVASPFPLGVPKHEDELIVPARDGALRVLRAARDAGVRRVVLTSSFAAVGYGQPPQAAPFDETSWTNLDADVSAYVKSKTIAERAAWSFIASEGGALELSVVNPTGVLGPVLAADTSTSIQLVKRMLDGDVKGCPKMAFGIVDVRDVADLHIKAMSHPSAKGERFLAVAGNFVSILELAKVLKRRMGAAANKVPTFELPNWVVRLGALADPSIRQLLPELGKMKKATSEKARRILNWTPRSAEDSIVATAESLVRLGLLKAAAVVAALILLGSPLFAQETKPVPKDSVRVGIPGCTKGQVFTAGRRTEDEPGSVDIPEGTHLRMNGSKQLMAEIKAHEGSMIQIVGIMKRGQFKQGLRVGGVGISAGPTTGGGISNTPVVNQMFIDVEGWRPVAGSCPTR
jgi:nucleoside-diphosphate-sugar epimerase